MPAVSPSAGRRERRPPPPLDAAALDRLALRYVERFATSEAKLADYLRRKVRERGWEGAPADPAAVAARMTALGYVDDLAFAEARARSLGRRGLGKRRIDAALRAAGIGEDEQQAVAPQVEEGAVEAALSLARRKRIGPFARAQAERPEREKQLAAMLRGGHALDLARRIVRMAPGEDVSTLSQE
ncbi:regulatory protein RecX [Sphingomonas aracearum]|uniref:Regulatory protein RecX n=1 Tax=Sphingomonas aracearum TaxID=2283317 RepID=A0A369VZC2_9SPHN|nr:regulatory protein RecX [Sphingomonas aracearum]RDE06975.1 regulatory protein RecX [Sphingomonas aracearum]